MIKIGIDTGGTFTDLIAVDSESNEWFTAKVPSRPDSPLDAVLDALKQANIDLSRTSSLVLGTTVGTNALIERKGAKVVYITTRGFEDIPFIQRGNRKFHYDLHWIKPKPFLERKDCLGVDERIDYRGQILTQLKLTDIDGLKKKLRRCIKKDSIEAVAVSLLFSYLNPEHEILLGEWLHSEFPELSISLSHSVAPIWREYERGLTTIADAYLKPVLTEFIASVDEGLQKNGFSNEWALMKSNGGLRLARAAAEEPLQLLLSGLAGGVIGGKIYGLALKDNLITLDIGGTSTDIAVITESEQGYTMQYEIEFGLPLALPSIDVTTIGAGGGSIAWIDGGGFLRVGPQSASAEPGPVCYGKGGDRPTLTDANLILGRINPDYFLGGKLQLNRTLALASIEKLGSKMKMNPEQTALAIVDIANDNMMNAVRLRTVEVGIDPADYALVGFGGAGALHASAIARLLDIEQVLIPVHPGLCSAFGALAADLRCDKVSTTSFRSDHLDAEELDCLLRKLAEQARAELQTQNYSGQIRMSSKLALRYKGQNYEHDIELPPAQLDEEVLQICYKKFNTLHDEFYGYKLTGEVIEIVNVTVTAIGASEIKIPPFVFKTRKIPAKKRTVFFKTTGAVETPVYLRQALLKETPISGPAIIEEEGSTTLLEPGDNLVVNEAGSMIISIASQQ